MISPFETVESVKGCQYLVEVLSTEYLTTQYLKKLNVDEGVDPMSDLSTVDVAGEFIRAWDAESSGIIERFAHPDLTVFYTHFDEPIEGPDGFSNMLSMTHEYFPDLSITVNDVVDGADKTVVHWLYRATFVRGKMFGVEAVGQEVEVEGLTKYLFKDGQVVEERGIVDQFGLLNQLGVQL